MSDTPENTPNPPESVEFWADPGPGFTPEDSPEPPEPSGVDAEPVGWTPETVINVLQEIQAPMFNGGVNSLLGVSKVDWHHRQARLEVVAPAIAREWNKVEFLRSLAGATDRALILSYLGFEYLGPRAIQVAAERKQIARENAARQAQQQQQPQQAVPVDGLGLEDMPVNPDQAALADLPARRR